MPSPQLLLSQAGGSPPGTGAGIWAAAGGASVPGEKRVLVKEWHDYSYTDTQIIHWGGPFSERLIIPSPPNAHPL